MKWLVALLGSLSLLALAGVSEPRWQRREDFAALLQDAGARGTILVLDEKENRWLVADRERAESAYLPCSTFKIFNALVALDTGAVSDEHQLLKWDGVDRGIPAWNRDHDLSSAMQVSAVWFYQEMARRAGEQRMQYWLERVGYGNRSTEGGIDQFWLNGGLRISAVEQVSFLRRLADGSLPFSPRSQKIVRAITVTERTTDYVLHGKTGRTAVGPEGVGWYVGWLERGDRRWFFAMNIDFTSEDLAPKRIELVRAALKAAGAL